MVDVNKVTKDSANLLIEEIETTIQNYTEESIRSLDKQRYLAQKRQLLVSAFGKTSGGMTQLIIKDLITDIDQELAHFDELARYCNQYREYYTGILKVVKEAIEELKILQ